MNGTLAGEHFIFSAVSQLPLEGFSWNFISWTRSPFPTKKIKFVWYRSI